jgi:DNA-binding response OmpR family regulator
MSFQLVHLIGTAPAPLVDILRQELNQENLVQSIESETLQQAQEILLTILPDLVVFFLDSLNDNVGQFCQGIRSQLTEHRPIIVVASAAANKEQRIEYFLNGADDYLTIDIEPEEFAVRLLVHLRRNVELMSNSQTRLPGLPIFSRLIQRKINLDLPWALLLIELNHFNVYNEVYGRIPSEQILKTLAALLKSLILPPDIVGQIDTENFLVLTTPDKAEVIADHMCKQFDEVVPNFYSEKDQKRGYIISMVNEQISLRVPFVCLSIGIVGSENKLFKNYMSVFSSSVEMKNIAKGQYGSNWASERIKLTGQVITEPDRTRKILILETDAAMAFLLKSTLEMQGYQVETCINQIEAQAALQRERFDLLLMDPSIHGEETKGWEFCRWVRQQEAFSKINIICISSIHDREQSLNAGANLYLPKPFELTTLFTWVDRYLKR